MSHKKKAHQKKGHDKMGMVQPMAHPKGAQHLKPMKGHHKDVSGK